MMIHNFKGDAVPQVPMLQMMGMVPDEQTRMVIRAAIADAGTEGLVYFKGYGGTHGFAPFGSAHPDKSAEVLCKQLLGDDLVAVSWASKKQNIIGAAA